MIPLLARIQMSRTKVQVKQSVNSLSTL